MAKVTCPKCGAEAPADADTCPKCGAKLPEAARVSEGELVEGTVISEDGQLEPLIEAAQLVVPKRGKLFDEDGVGRFAIIRPCMSRGRRLGTQKLPPIYEPRMLAEHAKVFTGWPMYLDHVEEELMEELVEALQERGRSIKDLGGRVVESFYDPELTFEDDHDFGYRKGGVVGKVIPQRVVREMLEDDPGILQCSINAWPTRVTVGAPSWDRSAKGALIEGIRSKPMGSVDFVFRGGAGGRPLSESERHSTVSLLASAYDSDHATGTPKETRSMPQKKLSEMTQEEIAALKPDQLKEVVERDAPHLAEAFKPAETPAPAVTGEGTVTVEQLNEALDKQRRSFEETLAEKLGESDESAEERAKEMVKEREELRTLADHAATKLSEIERNGLPSDWVAEIRKNYVLLPSGPKAGIVLTEADMKDSEGKELTAEQVIEARIKADVEQSIKLIESAGGKPRVKGFGATKSDGNGSGGEGGSPTSLRESDDDAFIEFLQESGDLTGDDKKDAASLGAILEEVR